MEKAYISIRIGNRCETTKGYFLTLPSGTVYGLQKMYRDGCIFIGEPLEEILKMMEMFAFEDYAVIIYRKWLDLKGQELDTYMKNKRIFDTDIIIESVSREEIISYPLDIKGWEVYGRFLDKVLLVELPMWFEDGNAKGKIIAVKNLEGIYSKEYENFLILLSYAVIVSLLSSLFLNKITSYLVSDDNVTLQYENHSKDEIGILKKAFYDAVVKIKELIKELEVKNKELEELAYYDPLTGLPNRRYFFINAQTLIENAKRYNISLSVMVFDIDNI